MKIFLDARNPRFNGSWTYIENLLPALVRLHPDHRYTVLYDRVHGPLGLAQVVEMVHPSLSSLAWIAWSHTGLPRLLKRGRYQIYHSLKQMNSFRGAARRLYTVHGAHHFVYPQLRPWYDGIYWRALTRSAARTSDLMVAVSESDKRHLEYFAGIEESKIAVTHLAPAPRFRPLDNWERRERVRRTLGLTYPFVLYVGRVDPYKNIAGMIRAFARLHSRRPSEHRLVIVGEKRGYQAGGVFALVQRLGLQDRVVFTGHVHEDLEVIYNLAECFLFPSLYEAFGLAAVEAMACGLPVISSPVAGCIDVVGDAGILVDPLDADAISAALERVLHSDTLRQSLSRASLERAARFSWERCARETFALYERVLSDGGA